MGSPARSRLHQIRAKSLVKARRDAALKNIAKILEDQMTDMGLSNEEKNAKTAELVEFVSDVASSKLAPSSKHSKRLHSEGVRA